MQAERDVLRQRVLPRLQKVASKYGESVRIIDLRWGVNTTAMSEEQATKRIMDVCFEQIDKCNGRMICLIGSRYGWVADYDLADISERYGLKLPSNVSVTELEIQYGILQRKQSQKAMVFFRENIHSLPLDMYDIFYDNDIRLFELKEKLLKSDNCICKKYSLNYDNGTFIGLDNFEETVYLSLCEYIITDMNLNTVAQPVKNKNQFDAYIDGETQNYYVLSQLDSSVSAFINSQNTFAVLKADAGMGKTAFSSHMCKCWENGNKFFYFFCGYNAYCETPLQMLKYFINQIGDYLGVNTDDNSSILQENAQIFAYLINQLNENVIFLIDGINHLVCSYEERLAWLPVQVPDNVKFFFTTSVQDRSYEKLNEFSEITLLTIPKFEAPEQFIKHLLYANGKDIQDEILYSALRGHKIDNYYHAKMIADALVMMDQYDFQDIKDSGDDITAINSFLQNTLATFPKNIEGMALYLLHDYGRRIAPDLIPEAYIFIACNEGGLRASDLEKLLESKWDDISFERYISFLPGIIVEREDGCYDFSSSIIRTAVKKLIKWKTKKKIFKYIESLSNDDPLKLRCCLSKSLLYEHYDVVYNLIESNKTSSIIVGQFVNCLNYMEYEISTLLKKYELFGWFFNNIIPNITSIQEQDACVKVVLNCLTSISVPFKATALEYLGDCFNHKSEFAKAQLYFKDAIKELGESDYCSIGRLYYKLANVLCVNSEEEYRELKRILILAIYNYDKQNDHISIIDRMYCIIAKYQLIIMDLNHDIGRSVVQVFNIDEMKLSNYIQTPHLNFIERYKIEEIKEDNIASIQKTICLFNEYRHEAEIIYQEAKSKGDIEKIIDPFIITLNSYDVFGLSECRMDRLKEIKMTIEECLQKQFSLELYQTLGKIEYELANNTEEPCEKKQYLTKCCSIWGQFIEQLRLPTFSRKYISAEMDLVKLYLEEGDEASADEHLSKWSQAQYDYVINDLRHTLNQCKRYPDEIHSALLEEMRDEIADVNRTKAGIVQLGDDYIRCQDIEQKYIYHLIRTSVFKQHDVFNARERFSFDNFQWLKKVYVKLSGKLLGQPADREEIEFVCIYVLRLMFQMLDLVSDIDVNQDQVVFFDIRQYYTDRVFVLEERHRYEMQRLEKIWLGYMYSKALINQSSNNEILVEENCLLAIKIFNTLRILLYENEITPFNLFYPMINLEKINFELCLVKITLASYYKETGNYLSAAETYETATDLALALFGSNEESANIDHLYLKIALLSCVQSMENYYRLDMDRKVSELKNRYEMIWTLSLR